MEVLIFVAQPTPRQSQEEGSGLALHAGLS